MSNQDQPQTKNITIEPSIFVTKKLGDFNKLSSEYEILNKKLGEGFFGSVEVVQLRGTKQNRALKKIDKQMLGDKLQRDSFIKEVDILKTLDHPNILKVYEFYEDERYLYIITELCVGKELYDAIIDKDNETFSELEAMKIIQQCLSALQYAHDKFFTHRDIKPENIMIDTNTNKIKVIDWGTSTSFKEEKIQQLVGSAYYIAPEILKRRGYNEKVDIWSLGIVLYLLVTGETPYMSDQTSILFEEIKTFNINLDTPPLAKVSKECKDLLSKMLKQQPSKRISASLALKHPWFSIQPNQVPQKLLKSKLNSLKTFKYQSKLQMATIQYVASHLLSQNEKDELSELFIHLDSNKDGKLSKQEIYNGYKQQYGEKEAREIVEKIFNQIDVDNNGTIDYNEFLASTMNQQKLMSQTTLRRAFDLFDIDGDEQITAQEIKTVLQNNAETFDSQMWSDIVDEVDKDGNGIIDFSEFQSMMDNIVAKTNSNQNINNNNKKSNPPFQMVTRLRAKIVNHPDDSDGDDYYDGDALDDDNNNNENKNNNEILLNNKNSIQNSPMKTTQNNNSNLTPIKKDLEMSKQQSGKKEKLHKLQDDNADDDEQNINNTPRKQQKKK